MAKKSLPSWLFLSHLHKYLLRPNWCLCLMSKREAIRTNTKKHIIEHCFFSPRDSSGLDYSDAFFARAKFRGCAKNEKYRTATYLFLVKNLGNFTNKNAKNISEILIKIGNNFNFDWFFAYTFAAKNEKQALPDA